MCVSNYKIPGREILVKDVALIAAFLLITMLIGVGCGERALPSDPLEAGLEHLRRSEYALARDQLLRATAVYSNNPTLHCNLAAASWKLGETESAVNSLLTAMELAPGDSRPVELMAWVFISMENWEAARDALLLVREPSPRLLSTMALVENRDGETGAARSLLDRALELNPDYAPALYDLAVLNRDTPGGAREALEYFKHFKRVAGDNPRAEAGVEEFMTPTHADAPTTSESGTPNEQAAAKLRKARKAISEGLFDMALLTLKETVAAYPDNADALWELAMLYEKHVGKKERARKLIIEFHRLFPLDQRAAEAGLPSSSSQAPRETGSKSLSAQDHISKGLAFYNRKDWRNAARCYREALRIDGESAAAAYNLGLALKALGSLDQAATAFRTAIRLKDDLLEARYMLALTGMDLKRTDEAIEQLGEILRMNPDYSQAHFLLGILLADEREDDKARTHFERYLQLSTNGSSAAYAKRWLKEQ